MPKEISNIEFGKRIKELRDKHKYSLRQVSYQSKMDNLPAISPSYWSLIERGERNIPKPETLKRMAKGLRVSANEIMELAGYSEVDDAKPEKKKTADLKDDDLLLTFGGKPISDEDRALIKRLMRDYDEENGNER